MYTNKFSVLMAVYYRDNPALFKTAVDSIFSNTIRPDTFVLVVDGPVPSVLEGVIYSLIEAYPKHIHVTRIARNVGLASALNHGLEFCNSEWVFRADADDINHVNRFQLMLDFINSNPSVDIIGGAIQEIDIYGNNLSIRTVPQAHADILNFLPYRNPFNHMTVGYKKAIIKSIGGYPNVHLKEDYALWVKLIGNGALSANLPDILVNATTGNDIYRRRGGMKYAATEFALQTILCRYGFKSKFSAFIHGVARSSVFLAPTFIRKYFYQSFLRRNVTKI